MGVTCKELAEKLLRFRDGELEPDETDFLRRHLRFCPMCMDLLRSYEEVIEVLSTLKPCHLPAGLLERLKERMQEG